MISPALELAQSLNREVRNYRQRLSRKTSKTLKPGEARYREMKAMDRKVLSSILDETERLYGNVE